MSSKNKNGDNEIFRQAMEDVTPLPATDRVDPPLPRTPPRAFQQELDDKAAFRELMDFDDFDGLETGEELLWLKPGLQPRILRRLRRGHYSIDDTIDLHHLNVVTGKQVLLDFLEHSLRHNHGCIRIIHGKGLHSRDIPRLKVMSNQVLFKHPRVVAYASCRPVDGGTGATDALLSAPKGVRK